jgi:hypothetical protein
VTPTIVGAGLAGLIAAHAWPNFPVLEASPEPRASHKALLRFRTDAVSRLTGIEFKKVLVRKGLWSEGHFAAPNIKLSNQYSMKVLGRHIGDRSIWNLDPVERYIAPENLYEQLVESVGNRISWNHTANVASLGPVVSTIPLPVTMEQLGIPAPFKFERAAIEVQRFRLYNTDVYQTIYFPDPDCPLYRASITGSLLILEFCRSTDSCEYLADLINDAFGIDMLDGQPLGKVEQKYAGRKQLLFQLTHDHQVFSLGRFAIWKNILLDDVVSDISVLRKLMRSSSYELKKEMV